MKERELFKKIKDTNFIPRKNIFLNVKIEDAKCKNPTNIKPIFGYCENNGIWLVYQKEKGEEKVTKKKEVSDKEKVLDMVWYFVKDWLNAHKVERELTPEQAYYYYCVHRTWEDCGGCDEPKRPSNGFDYVI